MRDWRLPEHRREAFQRFYSFHLQHRAHPGMVYSFLPAIAEAFDLDADGRAWLAWLNGNTQNAVTSLLLLEAAPTANDWKRAVDFWNDHFKALEWDTDRRHQKSKFGVATEDWFTGYGHHPAEHWASMEGDWASAWAHAYGQPYMGRLSSWSMIEFARILLPGVPDSDTWMFEDVSGSASHRNGLALVKGYDSVYWDADTPKVLGVVDELTAFADEVLAEARERNASPDVGRLTMESALCTYKSMWKPNRRYPGCYADMMYNRIRKAETRFGRTFPLLWETRQRDLPTYLRLEDNPTDPGLAPAKQNWFRETGEIPVLYHEWPGTESGFDTNVELSMYGLRKDPSWTL